MYEEGKIFIQQRLYAHDEKRARSTRLPQPAPHGRWFLKLSLAILLISVLVWGWIKLSDPQTLPINTVSVQGDYPHVDRELLRQAILPYTKKGYIRLDVAGLQEKLQKLPWVASATVQRTWPDTVIIALVEHRPIARFGSQMLLSEGGEPFNIGQIKPPGGLPFFVGPAGQQKLMLQTYHEMSAILSPLSVKINALVLDEQQFWRLQLNNGLILLIGRVEPLERLKRFMAIYQQVIGGRLSTIEYVDLRYMHGIAVRYKSQKLEDKA